MKSRRTTVAFLAITITVSLIATGCSNSASPSATTNPAKKAASTTPAFVSKTLPKSPVGDQLSWFLGAMSTVPLTEQVIDAHFSSSFLKSVNPDQINTALTSVQSASGSSAADPSGASLDGLLVVEPSALQAVATIGTTKWTISISVNAEGLIEGLLLSRYVPPPTSWDQLDGDLAAIAPDVGFLAARVSSNGTCIPIHQVAASTTRPLASMFKLFVLGALTQQIAEGKITWDQKLTVTSALKSIGSIQGSLQYSPVGTQVTVEEAATKMISLSDNTAADMLINLVGRTAVESQVHQWTGSATLNNPFFTTRELFLLHYVNYPALANRYLALKPSERASFLTSSVDPLSLGQVHESTSPRDVGSLEWFASPLDMCRAFVGLQQLSTRPGLAPIDSVLSTNQGGIGLTKPTWSTVWFKGGSEPGVLTLGYLAKKSDGQTYVVVAMAENPAAAFRASSTTDLVSIARGAFGLIG
jgi:hypothetical protein